MSVKHRKFEPFPLFPFAIAAAVIAAQVVLFRGCIVDAWERSTRHAHEQSATTVGAIRLLTRADPPLLLVHTNGDLATTVDLRTGARVADVTIRRCDTPSRLSSQREEVMEPAGTLAFLVCNQTAVRAVDLATGAQLWELSSASAQQPELGLGVRVQGPRTASGPVTHLRVLLHDGRTAWLDLDGALRFDAPAAGTPAGHHCSGPCARDRDECYAWGPGGSPSERVLLARGARRSNAADPGPLPAWEAGLIEPRLVPYGDRQCVTERGDSFLVQHLSAAFEPRERLLSRVSRAGERRWTVRLADLDARPAMSAERALPLGDLDAIVLADPNTTLTLVHLDPDSGAMRARHPVVGARRAVPSTPR